MTNNLKLWCKNGTEIAALNIMIKNEINSRIISKEKHIYQLLEETRNFVFFLNVGLGYLNKY